LLNTTMYRSLVFRVIRMKHMGNIYCWQATKIVLAADRTGVKQS